MTYLWNLWWTSGITKVQGVTLMLNQNKTMRQYALGKFDDIVVAISQDPAMLVWLDNTLSRVGRPNENYARELMELFTLGVDNYTQTDVTEVARALTGWTVRATPRPTTTTARGSSTTPRSTTTAPRRSSARPATGTAATRSGSSSSTRTTGSVSGGSSRRSSGPSSPTTIRPTGSWTSSPASTSPRARSIKAMVEHIFRMEEFYAEPHSRRVLVRSPVEYVAAAVKQLEAKTDMSVPVGSHRDGPAPSSIPPTRRVRRGHGLDQHRDRLRARLDDQQVRDEPLGDRDPDRRQPARRRQEPLATPSDVVNALVDRFGLSGVPPQTRADWAKYVDSIPTGSPGTGRTSRRGGGQGPRPDPAL